MEVPQNLFKKFVRKKLEETQQNGSDPRNLHPSIPQKRIFWSLQFTKNLKIEHCVINTPIIRYNFVR